MKNIMPRPVTLPNTTRKRFSEKPIVAFTNSTVLNFILDFYNYVGLSLFWSHVLASSALPTIPDCIRYIIGVFCYNFKSQTNILASY